MPSSMKNKNEEPWVPRPRPCRFLQERLYESEHEGILAGVEERCTNDVYTSLPQLLSALSYAYRLVTVEQDVLLGQAGASPTDSKARIWELARTLWDAHHLCETILEQHPAASRDKYYTKEQRDAG